MSVFQVRAQPSFSEGSCTSFRDSALILEKKAGVKLSDPGYYFTEPCFEQRFQAQNPLLPDFRVNSNHGPIGALHLRPVIAVQANGGVVAVWEDYRNGDKDIYGQIFTSSLLPLGDNFRVNDDMGSDLQVRCAVAADPAGNFVVVWRDSRGGISAIYAQRYSRAGIPVGPNFRVTDDDGLHRQYKPAVAFNETGDFMVVWFDDRKEFMDLFAQGFKADGTPIGSNFVVNEPDRGGFPCCPPAISPLDSNRFLIVWAGETVKQIHARIFTLPGTPLGSSFPIYDDEGTNYKFRPAVTSNHKGQIVVVWEDARNGDVDIYAQYLLQNGEFFGSNICVTDAAENSLQQLPTVALDDSGNTLVIWEDYSNGGQLFGQYLRFGGEKEGKNFTVHKDSGIQNGKFPHLVVSQNRFILTCAVSMDQGWEVYLLPIQKNGQPAGSRIKINDDDACDGDQLNPVIAVDRGGGFVVAWEDHSYPGGDICARYFSTTGEPLGEAFRVNDDSIEASQRLPAISRNNVGDWVIAWLDNRLGREAIFAQRFVSVRRQGGNFRVDEIEGLQQPSRPAVGMDERGNFVIAWSAAINENYDRNLFVRRFFGSTPQPISCVNDVDGGYGGYSQRPPGLAVSPRGNFVVAWKDGSHLFDDGIVARLYSSAGEKIRSPFRVDSHLLNEEPHFPAAAMTRNGKFVIAWSLRKYTSELQPYYQINFRQFDQDGTPSTPPLLVNPEQVNMLNLNSAPKISADGSGRFIVAWEVYLPGNYDILAQRFSSKGKPVGTGFLVHQSNTRNQLSPCLQLGNYKIYCVWQDNRIPGTGYDIWANVLHWENGGSEPPAKITLFANYPNPFNTSTMIRFFLQKQMRVEAAVYDLRGRKIAELHSGEMPPGFNELHWVPMDQPSGIYFFRLTTSAFSKAVKLIYTK